MSDSTPKPTRRELLAGTFGVAGAMWLAACDGGADTDAGPGGGTDAGAGGTDAGAGGTDAGPGETDAGPLVCNRIGYEETNLHPPGLRHALEVPLSDVTAGVEVTYDIQGASRHPHTVVVTSADFARIRDGERVTITSSEDMGVDLHSHDVTLFCTA